MLASLNAYVRQLKTVVGSKAFWRRPFIRDVTIVAGGSALAQGISAAFSPVVTRIYGPEAFGVLGVLSALTSALVPVVSLCYAYAIVLPRDDADGLRLLYLSTALAATVSAIAGAIIILFRDWTAVKLGIPSQFLLAVPVALACAGMTSAYQQWFIRTRSFRISSRIQVIQALAVNIARIGIGSVWPGAVALVSTYVAGDILATYQSISGSRKTRRQARVDASETVSVWDAKSRGLAHQYRDFPLYRAPQTLLNASSQSLPVAFLSYFYGVASAGFYSLGLRIISLPLTIISRSVATVSMQRLAVAAQKRQPIQHILARVTLVLAAIGLIPLIVIFFFGPQLFSFIFGNTWLKSGEYARWLTLWSYVTFVSQPSIQTISILGLQRHLLLFDIVVTVLRLVAISIGSIVFRSDIISVILYSCVGALASSLLVLYVVHQSGRGTRVSGISESYEMP